MKRRTPKTERNWLFFSCPIVKSKPRLLSFPTLCVAVFWKAILHFQPQNEDNDKYLRLKVKRKREDFTFSVNTTFSPPPLQVEGRKYKWQAGEGSKKYSNTWTQLKKIQNISDKREGKKFIKTKTKCVVTCLPNFEWCTWPSLNAWKDQIIVFPIFLHFW